MEFFLAKKTNCPLPVKFHSTSCLVHDECSPGHDLLLVLLITFEEWEKNGFT